MLDGMRKHRGRLLALSAVFVVSVGSTGAAFAFGDTCSNVTIKLTNSTSGQIKVTKFEYYDYSAKEWRTEVMFGVDGHQKLEPGKSWSKKQDLEHIENDKTKFKVTYQSLIGGSKWEDPVSKETGDFTCKDAMTKEVVIDVGVSPAALKVEACTSQQATEIAEVIDWGADNWAAYEKVLEGIRGWPVTIGKCLEGRFKSDGKVVCEQSQGGSCSDRKGNNNAFASPLNKKCHFCPSFLRTVGAIPGKEDRQACYFAEVTHEWGHTCDRTHKTIEIIDNEAFNFWKSKHSAVTIAISDCGMD
jgi:hypothetical protein